MGYQQVQVDTKMVVPIAVPSAGLERTFHESASAYIAICAENVHVRSVRPAIPANQWDIKRPE